MPHPVWRSPTIEVRGVAELCVSAGVSPLLARLLLNRGVTPASVESFLRPSLADTHDPSLLPDMDKAVDRLLRAIDAGEKITIYGDYDVDGTTATALLLGVLRRAGAEVDFYIPDRALEGYGMNEPAMRTIRERGASVLLTVDCGITARDPIAAAHAIGLDVIVTDHHVVDPDRLPNPGDAVALIDPRIDGCDYPFPDLAGVGLAYKLGQALLAARDVDASLEDELDLVALGTIADVARLRGENRALAKAGLAVMSARKRPGIRALCEAAGVDDGTDLASYHVGFVLGPRINAAGRLDRAHVVVELLTTDDDAQAMEIANGLNEANSARREVERRITDDATKIVETELDPDRDPIIVVARDDWHPGVVGIVASRLVERFWRPAIVIGIQGDTGKGSGRSIPGFHIQDALLECADKMTTFGGHAAAAGLSMEIAELPALREQLVEIARERLTADHLQRVTHLDAVLSLGDIGAAAVGELDLMEPFGEGNPAPRFGFRGLSVAGEPRLMGHELQHLSATLTDGRDSTRVVAWNDADRAVALRTPGAEVDVAGRVGINEYRGRRNVQITVSDWMIEADTGGVDAGVYPRRDTPSDVRIIDSRRREEKAPYLGRVLARGDQALIYVRDDLALAQARKLLGDLGYSGAVTYCDSRASNGDMGDAVQSLGSDGVRALVSTHSVIPPATPSVARVSHVVFCHPPRDDASFLVACEPVLLGREDEADGGEDETRYVHLLFNERDIDVDITRGATAMPTQARYRRLYSILRDQAEGLTLEDWRAAAGAELATAVDAAAEVFAELDLVECADGVYRARQGERRSLDESEAYGAARIEARATGIQAELWRTRTPRDYWEMMLRHRRHAVDADGSTAEMGVL